MKVYKKKQIQKEPSNQVEFKKREVIRKDESDQSSEGAKRKLSKVS